MNLYFEIWKQGATYFNVMLWGDLWKSNSCKDISQLPCFKWVNLPSFAMYIWESTLQWRISIEEWLEELISTSSLARIGNSSVESSLRTVDRANFQACSAGFPRTEANSCSRYPWQTWPPSFRSPHRCYLIPIQYLRIRWIRLRHRAENEREFQSERVQ